jgi:CRISPR-associated protein Cas2
MYLLITYDIVSDKRRRKLDKILSHYGFRVNYSVFELEIDTKTYKKLLQKLPQLMEKRDSIRLYRHTKDTIENSLELNPKLSHPFSKEESYVL